MAAFHVRRLPHYHYLDRPMFLSWRLRDSLPAGRSFPPSGSSGHAFVTVDHLLDTACTGPLYLRRPEIAAIVAEAICFHAFDLQHYRLHAYVVMANHVHLLVTPSTDVSKLLQSLKRYTAREANRLLGQTGQPFWQDESYDRLVRDAAEFQRLVGTSKETR